MKATLQPNFKDYIQRGLKFLPQILQHQNNQSDDASIIENLFKRAGEFLHLRVFDPELLVGICCEFVLGSDFRSPEVLTTRFLEKNVQMCRKTFMKLLVPTAAERSIVMLINDEEMLVDPGVIKVVTILNQQGLRTSLICSGLAKDYGANLPKNKVFPFVGLWMKASYPSSDEVRMYRFQQKIQPTDPAEDQFCLRMWQLLQPKIPEKIECQYAHQQLIIKFTEAERWADDQILRTFEHLTKMLIDHKADLQEGLEAQLGPITVINIGPIMKAEISQRGYIELYKHRLDQWNTNHGLKEKSLLLRFLALHELELGLWADARSHLDADLPIAIEMQDREAEAIVYNNRGVIYSEQHQFAEAVHELEKCLHIFEEIHDPRSSGVKETLTRMKKKLD